MDPYMDSCILIELLYSPACKGADDTERLIRELIARLEHELKAAGGEASGGPEPLIEFRRTLVLNLDDPDARRIFGSPTVLINGRDSQLPEGADPAAYGLIPTLA
jgi:hypothetical protein